MSIICRTSWSCRVFLDSTRRPSNTLCLNILSFVRERNFPAPQNVGMEILAPASSKRWRATYTARLDVLLSAPFLTFLLDAVPYAYGFSRACAELNHSYPTFHTKYRLNHQRIHESLTIPLSTAMGWISHLPRDVIPNDGRKPREKEVKSPGP